MKLLLLLLLFTFGICFQIFAQGVERFPEKKNLWRTEVGPAFTGTGDMWGSLLAVEYGRYLTNRFRLAPGLGVWQFQKRDYNYGTARRLTTAKSLDLTGYYDFSPLRRNSLEVGVGGFGRHWQRSSSYWFPGAGALPHSTEYSLGYTLSLGVVGRWSEALGWNLRATLQNDTGGNTALSARAGFNLRF